MSYAHSLQSILAASRSWLVILVFFQFLEVSQGSKVTATNTGILHDESLYDSRREIDAKEVKLDQVYVVDEVLAECLTDNRD